ncbi:hypothetical protein ARMSODRAFT_957265 [Armillaria solidipes]|uniref:F-box domain-containing protein n=1 Tax=Armillaria solidipes TaxID=1076256 RepID=A0A2H3BL07_9AGAR|nr:hypothetical protein ARMSODRAFT_957265 [Armillaria solidipes]
MHPSRISLEEMLAKYDWIPSLTHPPDVVSILRTNDAPSPIQFTQLKTSLEGLKGPPAELEGDLDFLRNVVVSLETRMSRLQSFKRNCETVLSPIRRIPLEITIEIVRRSWKNSLSGFHVFRIQEGPWHLGQVCSSWRNVIEKHCPELWATMEVGSFSYDGKVARKSDRVEILRIVLERSRNHPLNFRFLYHSAVKEGKPDIMEKCFDIMVAHSKRWRAVEMTILPSLFPRLSLIHGKIDWLADMDLSCSGIPQSGDIGAFEVAPKLEKLHLSYLHPDASIRFPVTNLVSFSDVRAFSGDKLTPEYLNVVELAPKLRSFSYNDHSDYSIHNQMSTPLSFPHVMSRSLIELSTSSPNFLRSLVLPPLKKFTLTTMCGADIGEKVIKCLARALRALHEMLLRSLQELVIEFYEWVEDYDPIMQSLVTQLSEVSLVNGSFQHCMVPTLHKLGIYLLDFSHPRIYFINSAFVYMVASRLHPPSDTQRLTKLRLWMEQGRHDLDEAAKNALMSLRDEGLELGLSSDDLDEDPMFE